MLVHFICRGNVFRSIIAEAYLKSLGIDGIRVMSSGTVADKYEGVNQQYLKGTTDLLKAHGIDSFVKEHLGEQLQRADIIPGDVVICMNRIVYDECLRFGKLPEKTFVWDVTDIGEKGRVALSAGERPRLAEEVYREIATNVDQLVHDGVLSAT